MREPTQAISKSQGHDVDCPAHFANRWLADALIDGPPSDLAEIGTEVHAYRAALVQHLESKKLNHDFNFWETWVEGGCRPETKELIRWDRFVLPPGDVIGVELFMSCSKTWEPIELGTDHGPGYITQEADGWLSGTVDLLVSNSRTELTIWDAKSGWSDRTVTPFEPAVYGSLVMAHFPKCEKVTFVWEFMRHRSTRTVEMTRADVESWGHLAVDMKQERKGEIVDLYRANKPMPANPWAGICPGCNVACEAKLSSSAVRAVTDDASAQELAAEIYMAEEFAKKAKKALEPYVSEHGTLKLGSNFVVEIAAGKSVKYPVMEVLAELGVKIPQEHGTTPRWEVPLKSMTFPTTALKGYAKAKMREGLQEQLDLIEIANPRTTMKIRRATEEEIAELTAAAARGTTPVPEDK